ncbi:TonB-dependent receptor domain-containing protein [Ferrimonas balearica]|uniref:TonB-dependent receptor domain-containing protein n=1 Tax=Ferrimonas balearica TaxID=44012 RepID=UPI001C57C809|nr:TonB-dependent receptor [Ferrimonas balearica]MBW3164164.1 TonB-dependent receptor [Ferrimonas balearica]
MKNNSAITKAIRLALLAGATGTAMTAPIAMAAEGDEVERIEVTGSRIKRTDLETPVPVTVIDRSQMDAIGALNVADVLNSSPVAIAGSDQSNTSFSTTSVGLNTTSLRNLGEERTLVLVNGRRFVSGIAPSSGYAVDLNSIPTSIIERIEILKSASSAVYGSDAVAGVVNIITRNEFEGVELDSQYGISAAGDRGTWEINLTAGKSWDSGNAYATFGFDDDEGLKSSDRDFSAQDLAYYADENGNDVSGPLYSSYPPQGRVSFSNNDGETISLNADGTEFMADGKFNRAAYRQLVSPLQRRYAAAGLTQELSDTVRFFSEFNYNNSKTKGSTIEPTPLDVNEGVFLQDRNGTGGIDINSPLIPEMLRSQLQAAGITNMNETEFVRRLVEFGPRSTDVRRDTIRMLAGFDWELSDSWTANAYYSWGKTDQWQDNGGQLNIERALNALDVVEDDEGNLICADEHARLQGCVPLNLFGAGTVSQKAVDYTRSPAKATGQAEQEIFAASVAGYLPVELPGGEIGSVVGYEYRIERGSYQPGDLAQTGSSSTNRAQPTDGQFYTNDLFGELALPVLDTLSVNLAARYSDHSVVGGNVTWNAGVEYSPIESLKLRASAATAIRTPNIADLYGGRGETFASVSDPCSGVSLTDTGSIAENCRANPAILARMQAHPDGIFELTQAELQGTGGTIGGSELVQEEEAETYSVGLIWQIIDDISLTVDYYDISIDNAIASTGRTTVLRRCYESDPSQFDPTCQGQVVRNGDGALTEVDTGTANENQIDTNGVDVEITYSTELFGGDFNSSIAYAWLGEYVRTSIESADSVDYAGEVVYPENRAVMNLGYRLNQFDVSWRMRFWGSVVDSKDGDNLNLGTGLPLTNANHIDAVTYHDLNFGYEFMDSARAFLGVRNVFDKTPPLLPQATNYGGTGINTASEAYDVTGRYFYAGVSLKF